MGPMHQLPVAPRLRGPTAIESTYDTAGSASPIVGHSRSTSSRSPRPPAGSLRRSSPMACAGCACPCKPRFGCQALGFHTSKIPTRVIKVLHKDWVKLVQLYAPESEQFAQLVCDVQELRDSEDPAEATALLSRMPKKFTGFRLSGDRVARRTAVAAALAQARPPRWARLCPVHRAVAHVDGGTSHLAPRTLEERAPVPCLRERALRVPYSKKYRTQ